MAKQTKIRTKKQMRKVGARKLRKPLKAGTKIRSRIRSKRLKSSVKCPINLGSGGSNPSTSGRGRRLSSAKALSSDRPKSPGPRLDFSRMREPDYMKDMKFNTYIKKIKDRVSPSFTISTASMKVLDCWMKGMLHKIGIEAAGRMGRRKVLKPKIILRALKRILPKNIRNEAHQRGILALKKFGKSRRK